VSDVDCDDPLSANDIRILDSITTNLTHLQLALNNEWRPLFLTAIYRRLTSNPTSGTPSVLPHLHTLALTYHYYATPYARNSGWC